MLTQHTQSWTVSQAKTHLSTILRKARAEESQIIGTRDQCVLVPLAEFQKTQRLPIGTWLIQGGAKVGLTDDVILPSRHDDRPVSFGEACK